MVLVYSGCRCRNVAMTLCKCYVVRCGILLYNYSLLLGKNEHCPLETLNLHVPGLIGGRGGRGQGGGGIILEISYSSIVPHDQLEPHQPIQDTHSVES